MRVIFLFLTKSKNDPFAVGTQVCIGDTNQSVCPVMALLGYLAILCSFSMMGLHYRDRDLSPPFAKFCRMWAQAWRSTAGIAFVSVLQTRQPSWMSPILSSRRWADGNSPYLCTTFALRGSSWQASHRG